jgi:hypothetical protein
MEKFRFKIGDKEFEFLGLTFNVALLFEQKVQEYRAAALGDNPEAVLTIDAQFVEDFFQRTDWMEIFAACMKVVSEPQWKERFNEMGVLMGKYKDDFLSYQDFGEIELAVAETLKKNLLQDLNYVRMQNAPLTMQAKLMRNLFETLKKQSQDSTSSS